jgi:uncharacterized protein (DUF362 family)
MAEGGLHLHRSLSSGRWASPKGLIESDDVVLVKVNAQWKCRGCTNSDVVRGMIQALLEHPDGFRGEIVLFENGQGRGGLTCRLREDEHYYPNDSTQANAEDPAQSFTHLAETTFQDAPVSTFLMDPYRAVLLGSHDHHDNGYRVLNPHPEHQDWSISYPCFTTAAGNRVELKEGLWTGDGYSQKLKVINIPILKHHEGCGITGALKSYYGILSMHFREHGRHKKDGKQAIRLLRKVVPSQLKGPLVRLRRKLPSAVAKVASADNFHYEDMGTILGEMMTHVRAPSFTILDAIWVSHGSLAGYPPETTTRCDRVAASTDPVALDGWGARNILLPVSNNPDHDPDHPENYIDSNLSQWLDQAVAEINRCGGIAGRTVTRTEAETTIWEISLERSGEQL